MPSVLIWGDQTWQLTLRTTTQTLHNGSKSSTDWVQCRMTYRRARMNTFVVLSPTNRPTTEGHHWVWVRIFHFTTPAFERLGNLFCFCITGGTTPVFTRIRRQSPGSPVSDTLQVVDSVASGAGPYLWVRIDFRSAHQTCICSVFDFLKDCWR